MKQATFRVIDPKSSSLINEYKLEYSDGKHLNSIYQEARQVWGEYQVEVETEEFKMSSSHTYQEQLRKFSCIIVFLLSFFSSFSQIKIGDNLYINDTSSKNIVYVKSASSMNLKELMDSNIIKGHPVLNRQNRTISLSPENFKVFKAAYTNAVNSFMTVFYYDGSPINVKYGEYIIQQYQKKINSQM